MIKVVYKMILKEIVFDCHETEVEVMCYYRAKYSFNIKPFDLVPYMPLLLL